MRPVRGPANITMFDRVVVNVIHVAPPVFLVPEQVFPVTPLPQCLFLAGIKRAVYSDRNKPLDLPPPLRKIIVAFGQLPDTVQVVGQYDDGIHGKRAIPHDAAKGISQPVYRMFFYQPWVTLICNHGEEITPSVLKGPSVFAHLFVGGYGLRPLSTLPLSVM